MGYVRTLVNKVEAMSAIQRKTLTILALIWAFFHYVLWSSAGYSIRHPVEYFGNYLVIVALPTFPLGALYIAILYKKNPHILPTRFRKYVIAQQRKETLKKRVDEEWTAWVWRGIGDRLFLRFMVPFSLWLMQTFPYNDKIYSWCVSVLRRYHVLWLANTISYPKNTNGYFLSIIEYYWGNKQVTFELCPTIGTTKAKAVITKRLVGKLHKPANQIKYTTQGNHLFVTIPRSWLDS